ncbi:MAG: NfeD family protein [Phycisphaerae bacterium]
MCNRTILTAALALAVLASAAAGQDVPLGPDSPSDEPRVSQADRTASSADYPAAPPDARFTEDGWFDPIPRDDPKPTLEDVIRRAFLITIHGPIDGGTYKRVKRKAFQAITAGAELVIFEMDTPGGAGDAMEAIMDLIRQDFDGIRTVAYINRDAYSAGALIALACDEIVVAPGANFGDSMPIFIGPGGQLVEIPEKERGKIEAGIKSKLRALAKDHGYNVAMCEAMVTSSIELWLIRNEQTAQLVVLDVKNPVPGLLQQGEAQYDSAGRPLLAKPWIYLRRVDKATEPLTMTGDEALYYGFARKEIANRAELKTEYGVLNEIVVMTDTTQEKIAAFVTSPAITSILILLAIGGIYMEMNTPGIGVPIAVACSAFAILIAAHVMLGLANWVEVGVFVLGVILLIMEVFVIPGFGVAGISGIALMFGALLAMVMPNAPTDLPLPSTDATWSAFQTGLTSILMGFIGSVALVLVLSRILPKTPIVNELFLGEADHFQEAPADDISPIKRIRPGDTGITASTCRPVGRVRIGEDLIDAVANGSMIDRGQHIRVVRNDGNRLVIEEA